MSDAISTTYSSQSEFCTGCLSVKGYLKTMRKTQREEEARREKQKGEGRCEQEVGKSVCGSEGRQVTKSQAGKDRGM